MLVEWPETGDIWVMRDTNPGGFGPDYFLIMEPVKAPDRFGKSFYIMQLDNSEVYDYTFTEGKIRLYWRKKA